MGAPVPAPQLSILRVSKQVYAEAMKAGWEGTRKCFFDLHVFEVIADSEAGPKSQFNCLGKIELNFTHKMYFQFFGVEDDASNHTIHLDSSKSKGSYLTRIPNLTELRIRFRNFEDGWLGFPWTDSYSTDPRDYLSVTCCQRTMVDWIMTLAFPFIKSLPKVTLEGYVRKPSKDKWEHILQMDKDGVAHGFDHGKELSAILSTPAQYVCQYARTLFQQY
ncbi:hypothetical protein K491DRAFT_688810 [Lophiostoma macrostomum CBS 122681]|uniref:Uncharacterized protein n=1 Tax=Lophiostoma macrostomum CBS 122681 TaxID=1314788 RepID=A0A6A6TKI3_9PLEO|nr:hypothetical protein K491DRAFT_688810 [Lophiostoma macrostomum CBS 122681]